MSAYIEVSITSAWKRVRVRYCPECGVEFVFRSGPWRGHKAEETERGRCKPCGIVVQRDGRAYLDF